MTAPVDLKATQAAVGARMRELRTANGWSQRATAEALRDRGIRTWDSALVLIEDGRQGISLMILLGYAELFGVHPAALLYDDATPRRADLVDGVLAQMRAVLLGEAEREDAR